LAALVGRVAAQEEIQEQLRVLVKGRVVVVLICLAAAVRLELKVGLHKSLLERLEWLGRFTAILFYFLCWEDQVVVLGMLVFRMVVMAAMVEAEAEVQFL
jgi:hypothetical protein